MSKAEKLKKRLNQLEEIIDGTDELPEEEKKMLNTTISTIFNLHMQEIEKKVG